MTLEGPAAPPSPVPEVNEGADCEDNGPSTRDGPPAAQQQEGSRLKNTLVDLSVASSENSGLRAQLDGVTRDRDELRRRLDAAELKGGGSGARGGKGASSAVDTVSKPSISFLHLILVAVIAYLVGHFT